MRGPLPAMPADNTTIVAFDKEKVDPLLFTWKAQAANAEAYELQFASDPEFKSVLSTKKVNSDKFILKERFESQKVYWRVRAVAGDNQSNWSAVRSYEIQVQ